MQGSKRLLGHLVHFSPNPSAVRRIFERAMDFNNDHPVRGERMERSREINYPNLGFHAILNMRHILSGIDPFLYIGQGGGKRTK